MARDLKGSSERVVAGAPTGYAAVGHVVQDVGRGDAAEVDEVKGETPACRRTVSRALDRPVQCATDESTLPDSEVFKGAELPQEIPVGQGDTVFICSVPDDRHSKYPDRSQIKDDPF